MFTKVLRNSKEFVPCRQGTLMAILNETLRILYEGWLK